jgi:hypothetical protein
MSVILVYEEFVSAFGSRFMKELCESCKRLIKLFGTNEFAVPWRCTCNASDNPDNQVRNVQHQLSLRGSGDFCRLGCCDFSDIFAKHECKKEQRS